MDRWLTTTALGLIVLGLIIIFLAALIAKVASKLWRRYLRERVLGRLLHFLEANIRPFVISRVLTNRYMHNKDYFRFVSHTSFAIMGFALSSIVELLLLALIAAYFIVNGIRFSWTLFVLFSLTGFCLLGWLRDAFYLYGVMEQTFYKDTEIYKRLFPKLHPNFVQRLMTEDIETVVREQEKALQSNTTGVAESTEKKDGPKE
jgi:hypothetical protein